MITIEAYERRISALLAKPFYVRWNIGLSFPPGWTSVIERMVAKLEALAGGDTLRCIQQKEKFGTLRCYLHEFKIRNDTLREATDLITHEAEGATRGICYVCGEAVELCQKGRILALCHAHEPLGHYQPLVDRKNLGKNFSLMDHLDQTLVPYDQARLRAFKASSAGYDINTVSRDLIGNDTDILQALLAARIRADTAIRLMNLPDTETLISVVEKAGIHLTDATRAEINAFDS